VLVVAGPGGVGKDTLVRRLLEGDDRLWLSRSWTTRPPRPGERADAYHYVDRPTFEANVAAGDFLEWAEYLGHLYGTPWPRPEPGQDVALVIEVKGAAQVLERVPGAVMVLALPPSPAEQEARMRERGDTEDQLARRLASAPAEVAAGRRLAHHVVVNDSLEGAVGELRGILTGHRLGRG